MSSLLELLLFKDFVPFMLQSFILYCSLHILHLKIGNMGPSHVKTSPPGVRLQYGPQIPQVMIGYSLILRHLINSFIKMLISFLQNDQTSLFMMELKDAMVRNLILQLGATDCISSTRCLVSVIFLA